MRRKRKRDDEDDGESDDDITSDEENDIDENIDISKSGQKASKISASRKKYLSFVRNKATKYMKKYVYTYALIDTHDNITLHLPQLNTLILYIYVYRRQRVIEQPIEFGKLCSSLLQSNFHTVLRKQAKAQAKMESAGGTAQVSVTGTMWQIVRRQVYTFGLTWSSYWLLAR